MIRKKSPRKAAPQLTDTVDLLPDPRNPRKITEKAAVGLGNSLDRFGDLSGIVFNKRTGELVCGHRRMEQIRAQWGDRRIQVIDPAKDLHGIMIDDRHFFTVRMVDWSVPMQRAANVAANSQMIAGTFTDDLTTYLLEVADAIREESPHLLDDLLLSELVLKQGWTVDIDEDDVPAPPDKAVTKPGDLWILGSHRLLCGDSSKAADVDRLMDGAEVHLCNTDPPYNVKVEPRSNNAIAAGLSSFEGTSHHQGLDLARHPGKSKPTQRKLRPKDRPLMNDFVTDAAFDQLLDAWFGNVARLLQPGRAFYIWGGYANCANYPPFLKKHGLYFSQALIWDKQHPVLTRKDFMGAHEWCFYGWREGGAHQFFGPSNVPDLWQVKKINPQAMEHLTAKPAELAARAMQYSSRAGENVLDLFGGSGSTLIGAEQTGRTAFLMELDPLYCDVICDRFQRFTGKPAIRERTGNAPIPMKAREMDMR